MGIHRITCLFGLAACALLLAGSSGCSSQSSTLVLRSTNHERAFEKTFSQAYAGRTSDGRYEFVLVSDDASRVGKTGGMAPIHPTSQLPLRQVVYVKVLYLPMKGIDASAPTANAAIDWYVLNDTIEGQTDVLKYQGAGLVNVFPGEHTSTLVIRNASVKAETARGNLVDPLGDAQLTGKIKALNDSGRTRELIEATRSRTAVALQASAQSSAVER